MARNWRSLALTLAGLLAVADHGYSDDYICHRDYVGFYGDESAVLCVAYADSPGETARLWLFAYLMPRDALMAGITAEISGFPTEGVVAAVDWLLPHEGGEGLNGVHSWRFDPPVQWPGPLLQLAVVDLYLEQPLPDDVRVEVQNGSTIDAYGQAYETYPSFLTINCTGALDYGCGCDAYMDGGPGLHWLMFSGIQPAPESEVSGEFSLEFTMESHHCSDAWGSIAAYPLAYDGEVRVEGVLVQSFSGSGHGDHSVPLSTTGLPPGGAMTITLLATNQEGEQGISFRYLVDDLVPAAPESWSRIKARY